MSMTSSGLFPENWDSIGLSSPMAPPHRASVVSLHCPVSSVDSGGPRGNVISQPSVCSESTRSPASKSSLEGPVKKGFPGKAASCLSARESKYTCVCVAVRSL